MIQLDGSVRQAISASSAREAGYYTSAFSLVPGWVVRGALAGLWLREHGSPSVGSARRSEFLELFEGSIRYGSLMVVGSSIEPLSVGGCKYPKIPECSKSFVDLAVVDADVEFCPVCSGPLELLKGAVRGVHLKARSRVALDDTERARDGSLFTREEIPAGVALAGMIDGEHPWLAALNSANVWFGGRRSTSGLAVVSASTTSRPNTSVSHGGRLVVRSSSPLIAVDRFARPMLRPDSAEVARLLGVAESSVRLVRSFTRPVTIGGWHLASGLPKPREIGAAAGSTFVYDVNGLTADGLSRLASSGLGLRLREGFGWIDVNPPAWHPPAEAARVAVERTHLRCDALLLLSEADRRWVVEQLRERMLHVETSNSPQQGEVEATVRFAMLNPAQQDELREALASTDLGAIRSLINELRSER